VSEVAGPNLSALRPRTLQRSRLVDEIVEQLREMIFSGELAPGTQLLQIELSKILGVSRTPLREAFRVLERDGLLRIVNGNRTVEVFDFSPAQILQLYEVRQSVDTLAARLAARAPDVHQFSDEFDRCLSEMKRSIEPFNLATYGAAHADFHVAVAEASGNPFLRDLLPIIRMSSQMILTRRLQIQTGPGGYMDGDTSAVFSVLQAAGRDHERVTRAILEGSDEKAEAIAYRHIQKTMDSIKGFLISHTEASDETSDAN
jgi:GntR family transcriptional regulator of vanillate catabolism